MKLKAVIWDIDGTLLDTSEGIISAYEFVIEKLALPKKNRDEIYNFIGPVPQKIFQEKFCMSAIDAQMATDIFRERYKSFELLKAKFYPEILNVLEFIKSKGILQAVATNKRQDYALTICHHFGISNYCKVIYGTDNYNTLKKSDLILNCLNELTVSPKQSIMIGDTIGDMEAAEKANVKFCGVNYGYGFKFVNQYADIPVDLIGIINKEEDKVK